MQKVLTVGIVAIIVTLIVSGVFFVRNRQEIFQGTEHLLAADIELSYDEKLAVLNVIWAEINAGKKICELTSPCKPLVQVNGITRTIQTLYVFVYRIFYTPRPHVTQVIFYSYGKERPELTSLMVQHVTIGQVRFYRQPALACDDPLVANTGAFALVDFPRGEKSKLLRAQEAAKAAGLSFFETKDDIIRAAKEGKLEPVYPTATVSKQVADKLMLCGVAHPFGHQSLQIFLERLANQHIAKCGKPLVVTSIARTSQNRLVNASELSVHPAGIAVDFRIPRDVVCRTFLQETLTHLNEQGAVIAFRENNPPHIHVMVLPTEYLAYIRAKK